MKYLKSSIMLGFLFSITACVLAVPQVASAGLTGARSNATEESLRAQAIRQISVAPDTQYSGDSIDAANMNYVATAIAKKLLSFDMGFETYNYRYEENVEGAHFMDLKGVFKGFYAKMAYHLQGIQENSWEELVDQFALEARMAFAKLDYNGGVSDGMGFEAPLSMSGIPDMVTEIRATAGRDFTWQGITITPFSGFGFRYLVDDSSDMATTIDYYGSPEVVTGYKRKSYYYYLPVGLTVSKTFANEWHVALTGEFDQLLSGTQKSMIETGNGRVLTNRQNRGFGLRGSLRVAKDFRNFGLAVEPFIRYWDIEDSDWAPTEVCTPGQPCMGGLEPSNTTKECGLKVGITF
ncbi:MAG: hypothetical protein HGA80_04190 [Candidatus Omnitrophica bacterium]|nr:hypothetical protein [Candidatus Omnitrophota bacterium]